MRQLIQDRSTPLVYVITDRRLLTAQKNDRDLTSLINFIKQVIVAGADMVQIRERDLSARALCSLTDAVTEPARKAGTSIIVNDRADVAVSTRTGVHLTSRSLTAGIVRAAFGADLLIGVSTHSLEEAEAAERGGADFIVFGPVFETPSKREYGDPVGLDSLHGVTNRLRIPVLALGGINRSNYREALGAGAAGVAGISMFTEAHDLKELVATIKERGIS